SGDRGLSGPRTVTPRCGAAAHHHPDRHLRRAAHAPAAGGVAVLLARRTGPDGPAGQPAAARTLQRLGPAAIRPQQPRPCLGIPAGLTPQPASPELAAAGVENSPMTSSAEIPSSRAPTASLTRSAVAGPLTRRPLPRRPRP